MEFLFFIFTDIVLRHDRIVTTMSHTVPALIWATFVTIKSFPVTTDVESPLYLACRSFVLTLLASFMGWNKTFMTLVAPVFLSAMIRYGVISSVIVFSPLYDLEANALAHGRDTFCVSGEPMNFAKNLGLELYKKGNQTAMEKIGPVISGVDAVTNFLKPITMGPDMLLCTAKRITGKICVTKTTLNSELFANTNGVSLTLEKAKAKFRETLLDQFQYVVYFILF